MVAGRRVDCVSRKICDRKWAQVGHYVFDQVEIFHGMSLPETAHLFNSNGLAIWSGF